MDTPQDQLRTTLAAYERERVDRVLLRLRDQAPGPAAPAQRDRAAWLLGPEGRDALEELAGRGDLLAVERDCLRGHMAAVQARALLVETQQTVRNALTSERDAADGRVLAEVLADQSRLDAEPERRSHARRVQAGLAGVIPTHAGVWREVRERVPEAFPEASDATRQLAQEFLERTEDAAREHVRWLVRSWAPRGAIAWHTLYRATRLESLDGRCPVRDRFRRAAAAMRLLGFERHLAEHLRLEPAPGPSAECRFAVVDAPVDIRVAQHAGAGVWFDLCAWEGLGTALGWSLCARSLRWEMRTPLGGGPGPVLGGLFLGWYSDPVYQSRVHQVAASDSDGLRHRAALLTLLAIRLAATRVAGLGAARGTAESLELRATAVSGALCCEVPPVLAGLLWTGSRRESRLAEGRLLGLALHVGLRQHYDDDCFRNPKTAEALRELCARGNFQDPYDYLAALGAAPQEGIDRMFELLP